MKKKENNEIYSGSITAYCPSIDSDPFVLVYFPVL